MNLNTMEATIWAYPWDVTAIGVGRFLDLIESAGTSGVSLATAYHAGLFLTPHNPNHRLYFPEDGVLYFKPTQERSKKLALQPRLSRLLEAGEPLRGLIDEAHRRGLKVNSWFVCTHNTALGTANPDVVLRTAYGDPLYYGLCPSNPKVVEYLVTLLGDLSQTNGIDAVDAESLNFLGYPHGYHHEKDLVGLSPEACFLLSICFCGACQEKARAAGIDVDHVRGFVQERLDAIFSGELASGHEGGLLDIFTAGPEGWTMDPDLQAYLRMRVTTVMELVKAVRESLRKDCWLRVIEWMLPGKWWMYGFDDGLDRTVDGMIMCCYDRDTERLQALIKATKDAVPNTPVAGGIQAGYPTCTSPADVCSQVQAVRDSGADGIQIYNFGLMRQRNLEWLGAALRA